jgi:hypothetical protein
MIFFTRVEMSDILFNFTLILVLKTTQRNIFVPNYSNKLPEIYTGTNISQSNSIF